MKNQKNEHFNSGAMPRTPLPHSAGNCGDTPPSTSGSSGMSSGSSISEFNSSGSGIVPEFSVLTEPVIGDMRHDLPSDVLVDYKKGSKHRHVTFKNSGATIREDVTKVFKNYKRRVTALVLKGQAVVPTAYQSLENFLKAQAELAGFLCDVFSCCC